MAPTVTIEYTESKGSGVIMGKSRKVSKGHSSGFVPDYRHAVETMAESEGFGSSGRVDMEMAVSENSYAPPKRNRNDRDRFSVPLQFLPLSKLSRTDRKDLELRLRNELDQVRILQRRITSSSTSVGMNSVVHSPASDIHSYSDSLKRPRPVQALERSDKKRPLGKNGPRTKGTGSKHIEPVKPSVPSDANNVLLIQKCDALLKLMIKHEQAWVFKEPVDVVKLNIPEYRTIIKHPMDFGTIMRKLHAGLYADISGFADDVRLTFNNATTFNPPGHNVHTMANIMSKFFEMRWKQIEKKITSSVGQLVTPRPAVSLQANTAVPVPMPSSKKAKSTPVENLVQPENKVKPVMSAVEKTKVMSVVDRNKLSADLESLIEELPESIVDFLKRSCSDASKANEDDAEKGSEDEIEIDVDALNDDTLFTLRKLLDDYLSDKQKNQAKETNIVAIQNESGLSTSFPDPQKGNDLVDEEVDIGGDDLVSSFPPVEIDKDTTLKNNKINSSSGSSSNSDSDSGSSSSGDSDVDKDTTSPGPPKQDTGVHVEPTTDAGAEETLNSTARQDKEPVMAPAEANIQEEAESAPPERTVSPDKLYRAALLRSRFADTIIKAQEKTLEQSDKLDPEKLRLEREELERRRREEKARLQAEAKAAEEARKKAEEAAAAEAKKKRELEREAARQALQKMEKTVDINENCQFMGDLEMFRSAPDEHLSSFIEETSPNHSQDGLGSFNFRGGSPLMQKLGLYRKKDDDEEEEPEALGIPETEPKPEPEPEPEPEEGEID